MAALAVGNSAALENALRDVANAFDNLWNDFSNDWENAALNFTRDLSTSINDLWNRARSWFRRDPLALDLDGDGLETVGATGTSVVLFDHDGDGIKTGTGWVKADDGLLVLDRNANGSIDNGSELFGIDTVLSNGQKAANGFAALADLDANHDGVFNASDTAYTQVRLWQDLNQDGLSQATELKTLAALGITGINLNATAANQALAGGNVLDLKATFTRSDGSTGTAGALNLVENPFYRQYPDGSISIEDNPFNQTTSGGIVLTPAAQALPDMHGSGAVRDLREAASLDSGLAASVERPDGCRRADPGQPDGQRGRDHRPMGRHQRLHPLPGPGQKQRLLAHYLPQGMSWEEGLGYIPGNPGMLATPEQRAHLTAMQARQGRLESLLGVLERFNGNGLVNRAANDGEWRRGA